jgi:hypothetical protein
MIDKALRFLTDELNTYLLNRAGGESSSPQEIVLTNVAKSNGDLAIPTEKLGLSLINIEEERVMKEQRSTYRNPNGDIETYNPEIKVNLYVLISANYINVTTSSSYEEGLKQLSGVISFFQGKNVFVPDNSPTLDPSIQKLIVELYSFSFEQQYNFWSVVGAKYMPSVLYRVRLVSFQEKRILEQAGPVTQATIGVTNIL